MDIDIKRIKIKSRFLYREHGAALFAVWAICKSKR